MNIPKRHLQALVWSFQAESDNLVVDGIYGPKTAAALDEYIRENEAPVCASRMQRAFESALKDVGKGEDPLGSNKGPYIAALRAETGLAQFAGGEWCAVFASAHLERNGIPYKSRGAYALGKLVAMHPDARILDPEDLRDGLYGLVVRERSNGKHVQLFRVYSRWGNLYIEHVGGNERHKVRSDTHEPADFLRGAVMMVTIDD